MSVAAETTKHNVMRGVLAICAAFFLSALTGVLTKFMHGVSPLTITIFQYGVSLLIFLPLALKKGWRELRSEHLAMQVVRSVSGAGSQLLYFVSLRTLTLLDASLLANASPLFIPIVVWVWLRKPVQRVVWASLAVGLVGVVLVIRPGPAMFRNPAALLGLGAGALSAVGLVTTNKLAETDPPIRILAYNFGVSTALLLPAVLWRWQRVSGRDLLLLVLLGMCFAGTQWLLIAAYRFASATELSPFNYSVVVFSGMLGWWVFGSVPAVSAVVGTVLICVGGIASIKGGHREGLGHAVGAGHWWIRWAAHWRWKLGAPPARSAR